jgi:hypothetical protein
MISKQICLFLGKMWKAHSVFNKNAGVALQEASRVADL